MADEGDVLSLSGNEEDIQVKISRVAEFQAPYENREKGRKLPVVCKKKKKAMEGIPNNQSPCLVPKLLPISFLFPAEKVREDRRAKIEKSVDPQKKFMTIAEQLEQRKKGKSR